MRELIEVQLPSGRTMWATVDSEEEARDVGFGAKVAGLPGFAEAVEFVTASMADGLRAVRPEGVSAEFGVELAVGERGLVAALCGTGGKATVKVTLTWGRTGPGPGEQPPAPEPR